MTDLETMTTGQLLELHNERCDEDRRLASWKGKKADLIERVRSLDEPAPAEAAPTATEVTEHEPRGAISASVRRLLLDPALSYADIVAMVRAAHPNAATTARSLASVACDMRKAGADVPHRR